MTTVGIMSMQRILNYGSSLQSYALKRLIESLIPSSTVEFVDYEPGPPLVGDRGLAPQGGLARVVGKIREYGREEGSIADKARFFNHKRTYADVYFPMIGVPAELRNHTDLDVQVIGSDEVFNCVQSNTLVGYARDLFGHGSRAKRIISYAASFGNTTLESIGRAGIREDLQVDLRRFESFSVRDRNSQAIIEDLTGITPSIHVDPALAFDLMSRESRIPYERPHERPYIIVYAYPGRLSHEENNALRALADSQGLEILTFGGFQACGDRFVDCDPFSLLSYFRDAEAVVTDTFHGTVFSIINQRPFLTFVRTNPGSSYGNEQKLGFLLEMFGLSSRRVSDESDLRCALDSPINWCEVQSQLEKERQDAGDYLVRAIGTELL